MTGLQLTAIGLVNYRAINFAVLRLVLGRSLRVQVIVFGDLRSDWRFIVLNVYLLAIKSLGEEVFLPLTP